MTPTKTNTRPIVVAVVSDLHSGSTVGLRPPSIELDDGDFSRASPAQMWLWGNWTDFCKKAKKKAKKKKAKLIAVMNGDMTEGNHHHSLAVIGSGNETLQMSIAATNLNKLLKHADRAYFMRGTPVHVGQQARLEEGIANYFAYDKIENPNGIAVGPHKGTNTWWHLRLDVNGTLFDVAHHGSVGRLPWTKANALGKIATSAVMQARENGYQAPNVIIRSHLHQYVDSGDNYRTIRVIGTPAWQLITGFVQRISPGSLADIGGLIFTCYPGGEYECEVVRYHPRPDPVERIEL